MTVLNGAVSQAINAPTGIPLNKVSHKSNNL